MNKTTIILLFLVSLFPGVALHAQIALNGTAQINPYDGLQPELIKGVSALPAVNAPLLRHVYLVDKNILALVIDEQAVILSNFKPYLKEEGDSVVYGDYHGHTKFLFRKGEITAYLGGLNNEWYRPFNEMAGKKLDTKWISDKTNYRISSNDDPLFKNSILPEKLYKKALPNKRIRLTKKDGYALQHEIYLVLPENITSGNNYIIHFASGSPFPKPVKIKFDDTRLRSESIHVNLFGFSPEGKKTAMLSAWLGDGGEHDYSDIKNFKIADTQTGKTVFTGSPVLFSPGNKEICDYNISDTYLLDFTSFSTPGEYKIIVPGIGCSFPFEINDNIWRQMTRLTMKGFLHQRSGIELGPPYTDYKRPRNMHPEDGTIIHKCNEGKYFNPPTGNKKTPSNFERIEASIIPETSVPQAWGSWMDAGDFDQRMTHFHSVRRMLFLAEINQEWAANLNLNIPESENNIPDIIDEAVWGLELYRRTQGVYEDGGVSWQVESIRHPRRGEASYTNSLPTALLPPTPEAAYNYISSATWVSLLLKRYDIDLAEKYQKSALDAMKWIDKHPDTPVIHIREKSLDKYKAMAFISLYRLTGEEKWHNKFEKTIKTMFPTGLKGHLTSRNAEIFTYYLLEDKLQVDESLKNDCTEAVVQLANELTEGARQNCYGIVRMKNAGMNRMILSDGPVIPLIMAYQITKDKDYTDALSSTIQYTMGNNPMNRSYISGLGERCFSPYQIDWDVNNKPAPSGIPTYGPIKHNETTWGWRGLGDVKVVEKSGLYPNNLLSWPHSEKCFNGLWIAPTNEFTVSSPMGEILLLSGFLDQTFNQ